jgi:regulator of replication initiation timing
MPTDPNATDEMSEGEEQTNEETPPTEEKPSRPAPPPKNPLATLRAQPAKTAPPKVPTADELPDDVEELKSRLIKAVDHNQKLSRENAERRKRLDEIEETETKQREALLTEQDKAQRRLTKLEDENRTKDAAVASLQNELANTLIDHEIEREALRLSFANPEHAPRLVDRDKIEFDPETRKVTGAKAALEKFLKDYPDYAGSAARGGTGPSRAPANGSGARSPSKKAIDPYEQELAELGRGGRM